MLDAGLFGSGVAAAILGIIIYYLLPTSYIRLSEKALRHGSPLHPDITLTFEGNIKQWPDLLPVLRSLGIRAVFFVDKKFGEDEWTVSQLLNDGHECYATGKLSVLQRISASECARATESTQWVYRPQGGWMTLYHLWKVYRLRCRVVLWSVTWDGSRLNPRKLTRNLRNGSIVRIKGGPVDLQKFVLLLQRLKRSGFRFCTLQQLESRYRQEREEMKASRSPMNRCLFYAWKRWESFMHGLLHLEYVCTRDDERTLFRIRKRRYYGKPVLLADGQYLRRGEPIVELHLNNDLFTQVVQQAKSSVHLATTLIRMVRRSLPELSRYLLDHPRYHHIKAIYGITIIYRGADPFGFTVAPMPKRLWNRFLTFYLRLYLSVMHPEGRKRLIKQRDKLIPKRVMMSCTQLFAWYPPSGSFREEPGHLKGHKMERGVQKGGATLG